MRERGPEAPPAWVTATAGALAGVVSRFVVHPLDVLKIRFQVQLEPIRCANVTASAAAGSKYTSLTQAALAIGREEGLRAFWRGSLPGQLLSVPYTAAQFTALRQCKALAARAGYHNTSIVSFVSGAVAGCAGTISSYPLDLLRTTLAAQGEPRVYTSMLSAARGIVAERGVLGLYRGMGITLIEIVPYAALQFGLYDAFNAAWSSARVRLQARSAEGGVGSGASSAAAVARRHEETAFQCIVCGLASGMLAKLASHPLDVIKKRYQIAGLARAPQYGQSVSLSSTASIRACVVDIVRREGAAGFFKGLFPSLLKAAPAAACTFLAYEFFARKLERFEIVEEELPGVPEAAAAACLEDA